MRRTIRNGYEIDFDMQIYGRSTTNKDNTNLNKIWETFTFVEVLPLPPKASARILITDEPPAETNEQEFEIEGTAAEGVTLTAVVMGLSYPEPIVTEATAGKTENSPCRSTFRGRVCSSSPLPENTRARKWWNWRIR